MRVLVDENIPRMTVEYLRSQGSDVKDIRGSAEQGLPDQNLWQIALTEARLLVTTDKGFSAYRVSSHHGILVVRLSQPNRFKIHNAVLSALQQFQEAEWPNRLVIVRDTTISTALFR